MAGYWLLAARGEIYYSGIRGFKIQDSRIQDSRFEDSRFKDSRIQEFKDSRFKGDEGFDRMIVSGHNKLIAKRDKKVSPY